MWKRLSIPEDKKSESLGEKVRLRLKLGFHVSLSM